MPHFRTIEISDPRFEQNGLRHIVAKTSSLKGRGDITAFVPENTFDRADLPIVILLHGVYGSHWSWSMRAGVHLQAAKLIQEKKLSPMIIAMPSDGLWGDGSGYLRHATQDFESWIVDDVPHAVRLTVPQAKEPTTLFIGGLSMGGFGALRFGAKYPKLFRAFAGHSSVTHLSQADNFIEESFSSCPINEMDKSVFQTLLQNRQNLPPFRFDCGTGDRLIEANRELHRQLKDAAIPHTFEEFEGEHHWPYWEKHISKTLLFFNSFLKA
jgi:putative tributyrin esterase